MIKTLLYNAEAVAASTGGTLAPVELLLDGDTKKFAIELSVVTTRVATLASRKEFTLYWATTPENLDPATDNIPSILMECTHQVQMFLNEGQTKQKKQVIERCVAGEYLYVWAQYPQSADAYAVTISATQYSYASSGGSTTSPIYAAGVSYSNSQAFTRPADTNAYGAGDVVSNSTSAPAVLTFTNVGPSGGGNVLITQATLRIDTNAVPAGMTQFRLHCYSTAATAINDNAAYNLVAADRAKYLGFIVFPTPVDLGDTLWSELEGMNYPIRKQLLLASSSVFGILETVGAFTPTSACVKTITLQTTLV